MRMITASTAFKMPLYGIEFPLSAFSKSLTETSSCIETMESKHPASAAQPLFAATKASLYNKGLLLSEATDLQISVFGTIVALAISSAATFLTSSQIFAPILTAWMDIVDSSTQDFSSVLLLAGIRWAAYTLVFVLFVVFLLMIFDFFMSITSFLFNIPSTVIALIVCLIKPACDTKIVPVSKSDCTKSSVFSWEQARLFFVGINRIVLCYIFPPLAVSDMGFKKMFFVLLLTLCGWIPGVIAVYFCIWKHETVNSECKTREH